MLLTTNLLILILVCPLIGVLMYRGGSEQREMAIIIIAVLVLFAMTWRSL